MNRTHRAATGLTSRSPMIILAISLLCSSGVARGDVSPPVSIRLPSDRAQAVSGQEYSGEFLVTVHKPGTLSDFRLVGDGWTIVSFDPPATPLQAQPGTIRIPFRATPADADKSIGLQVRFNGRPARHGYHIGPAALAKKGKPGRLTAVAGTMPGQSPAVPSAGGATAAFDLSDEPAGPSPRGGTIVVEGRIVYDRPGVDRSEPPDGDFNDTNDIPPAMVGADGITVEVLDNDPVDYEVMWTGVTDAYGRFVTPPLDADVDAIDPAPDLILRAGALREDWGGVFNEDADWYYVWDSEEILNCEEAHFNFGTRAPLDPAQHPAIHVYNTIVRARRFILENPNIATRFVSVHWPADHWSEYHADDEEIHLLADHQWQESTIIHEYGHHFIAGVYESPPPDYCNGFCDGNGNCDFDASCPDPGHCPWCQENAHDAWNEGWPNWLADVVARNFPTRYLLDLGGPPYEALFPLNAERPNVCCVDGMVHNVVQTEGFVAALLRDIDDATLDDHDDDPDPNITSFDGIRDLMCIGPNHIFQVVVGHHPITVLDFLNGLRADWPQFTPNLRATAFNVGGAAYIAGFPSSDSQGPGPVLVCDSPSHPIGGGALPCMTIEWTPAADNVSGAVAYSYTLTQNPAGQEPDEVADPVNSTDHCQLAAIRGATSIGDYYFSIKAQDGLENWSSEWRTFGPFTVTDCNGSGLLDLCDIDCPSDGVPGVCDIGGLCVFSPGVECGGSEDCNQNYVPDECDIAQGQSEDCNQNGIPDECETATLKHWTGNDGDHPTWWELGSNWAESAAPSAGNDVCVAQGEPAPLLRRDPFTLGTLACNQDLSMAQAAGNPGVSLTLLEPSFILGNLSQTSGTIQVNDALTISGTFSHSGGLLRGVGQTIVLGGHIISGSPDITDQTLNLQCNTTASGGFSGNNFVIRNFLGNTYDHNGTGVSVADGNSVSQFINEGTFVKSGGTGSLRFGLHVNNSGLMRVEAGTLLFRGLTCTGSVVGLPGTTVEFGTADANFEPGSSLVGDHIHPRSSSGTTVNIRGTYQAGVGTSVGQTGSAPVLNFLPGANVLDYGDHLVITAGNVHFETVHGAPIQFQSMDITGTAHFDSGDPIVTDTLTFRGGIRGSSQELTINGLFTWRVAADFVDPGVIHANGGLLLEPSADVRNLPRVLNNAATATMLGGLAVNPGGGINNLATGVWDIQVDGNITGSTLVFNNAGTLAKTAGAGTATIGSGNAANRPTITNTGTVEVRSGTLTFSWGSFTQTAGQTVLNGGNLMMGGSPAMPLQLNGGALRGAGTVTAVVNNAGAAVEPGLSAGTLAINGAYNQSASGALRVEIGGTGAGQFDVLSVSGAATLGGELNVQTINGFSPTTGNTFVILTAGSISGTFGVLTGAAGFDVTYTPTQVILTATTPQLPGDLDGDCDVDIQDLAVLLSNFGTNSGATPAMGDVDGDGDVDIADLALLLASFGSGC